MGSLGANTGLNGRTADRAGPPRAATTPKRRTARSSGLGDPRSYRRLKTDDHPDVIGLLDTGWGGAQSSSSQRIAPPPAPLLQALAEPIASPMCSAPPEEQEAPFLWKERILEDVTHRYDRRDPLDPSIKGNSNVLGAGKHGKVKSAMLGNTPVGIKSQKLRDWEKGNKGSLGEAALHKKLSSLGVRFLIRAFHSGEEHKKGQRKLYMSVEKASRLEVTSTKQVYDVAAQVLTGLQDMHFFGIYHRDVVSVVPGKSSLESANIMMTDQGEARIIDVGKSCRAPTGWGWLFDFADARAAARIISKLLEKVDSRQAVAFKNWYLSQPNLSTATLSRYPAWAERCKMPKLPERTGVFGRLFGRLRFYTAFALEVLTARVRFSTKVDDSPERCAAFARFKKNKGAEETTSAL